MVVTYLDNSIECATALKGDNYVHLLDANGDMIAAFDEVSDFSGFKISGGNWTTPTDNHHCYIAVVRDDGTIAKGGHKCSDIQQRDRVANLLDNSWFINPINQRGQTQISENGYFVDRWMNYTGSQVLVSGGVRTTASGNAAYFSQYVESSVLRDGVYSFAAKVNGSICIRVVRISGTTITTVSNAEAAFEGGYLNAIYANSGRFEFMLRVEDGNSIVTEWAALYEGAYTADTLPAYVYKGYAAELAECQRYYVNTANVWMTCHKIKGWGSIVEIPANMRVAPTVLIDSTDGVCIYDNASTWVPTTISYTQMNSKSVFIVLTDVDNTAFGESLLVKGITGLSADL